MTSAMAKNGARLRSTSDGFDIDLRAPHRGSHVHHHIAYDLDSFTLQLKRGHKGADRREMSWCLCLVRFQTISYNYNLHLHIFCRVYVYVSALCVSHFLLVCFLHLIARNLVCEQ